MTSALLSALLGINDYANSRTLGNKSGCLSFNQKIELLIEIGALPKEDKKKFIAFMAIRNQFMHNLSASTYEKCFDALDGNEKYLLDTYPNLIKNKEEKLKEATKQLSNDVLNKTASIIERVKEKIQKEVKTDILKKTQQALFDSIEEVKTSLDDYFEKQIAKNPTFKSARLKGIGTEISKMIYRLCKQKISKED